MKCLKLALLVMVLSTSSNAIAQSRSFDIATFTPPSGWTTEDRGDSFALSRIDTPNYALIVIYRSVASTGKVQSDFQAAWKTHVEGRLGIKQQPKTEPVQKSEGWDILVGAGSGKNEAGDFGLLLSTAAAAGRSISIAAIVTADSYLPEIDRFLSSIKLSTKAAPAAGGPTGSNAAVPATIVGVWTAASSSPANSSIITNAGSLRLRYAFKANGTYEFKSESWGGYMRSNIWWTTVESGTFSVNGDAITIEPRSSKATLRNSAGQVQQTKDNPLERVTYKWTTHFFEGIGETNLVLEPPRRTNRDGVMGGSSLFPNAYLYKRGDDLEWRY